jgi:hypothetical protein
METIYIGFQRASRRCGFVAQNGLPVNLELPASGQPAFAERAADIHGRARAGVPGNLATD